MCENNSREQVLLLPFMAQGHIIPFLTLAKLLERKTSYAINFISTPLNIQRLKSSLPPITNILLTPLPFNSTDHGLPPGCENTDSTPPHLLLNFIQASQSLQSAFECLLAEICREDGRPPLCVISDPFMSWSVDSAKKFGVFHSIFNTMSAYGTAIFMSLWTHFPHQKTDADEFSLPDFPKTYIHRNQLSDVCRYADGSDPWSVFFQRHISLWKQSQAVLVNTVEDMEEKGLKQLKINLRRILSIGPVLPRPPPSASAPSALSSSSVSTAVLLSCTEWLNLHAPNSVLYISFGSQNSIHVSQMMELAKGLEASGKAFLWVVRPPIVFHENNDDNFLDKWLPVGFQERMVERKQGLLVRRWAPQLDILSHKSVGAFLSHCGWNSTLESLSRGVPIIGWPLSAEQFYNSKLLEVELGVEVELARGNKADIGWEDVVKTVRLVMDEESEIGRELRKKAKHIEEIMKEATVEEETSVCKGSSIRAMEEFFQKASEWRENGRKRS